ncbi:MAG TPA: hypothetical protein ENI65_03105 [Gammaproteobacteria bacterium]|nr:hypothetical protein [Gammaproteobacteria bacterium]
MKKLLTSSIVMYVALTGCTAMASPDSHDFGVKVEHLLNKQSNRLFGIKKPLSTSATNADYVPREQANADQRLLLAKGLKARYVSRNMSFSGDMMTLWPNEKNYSHIIVCIEQRRANGGLNAGVQRINVQSGDVETILYGMNRCDGIRRTAWGTVLATEEAGDGRAYEIIQPLVTTGQWIADRTNGDIRDGINSATQSQAIVQRTALPTMAWEGHVILDNGIVIGGDELRPGSYADATGRKDTDGGSIFKFVPAVPYSGNGVISSLSESPLISGHTYAMQVSCKENKQQTGQGCEIGNAAWVEVDPLNARVDANNSNATGYYRPEDMHRDPMYAGIGVKFCWTNTGREKTSSFGEVMCAVDSDPLLADSNIRSVVANRVFEGDTRFNSVDNLAFQPKTGNMYVVEDHKYGEIFACLPDGKDRDIKTDGCVGVLSVIDPLAEPTGFMFDASGKVAFIVIQHGEQPDALLDFKTNPVSGKTDDLIMITGFKVKGGEHDKDD